MQLKWQRIQDGPSEKTKKDPKQVMPTISGTEKQLDKQNEFFSKETETLKKNRIDLLEIKNTLRKLNKK